MTQNRNSRGESTWRWAMRITGLCGFILSGVLLALQIEVPLWLPLGSGGMMGLDSIQGFEVRKRDRDGER